MLSSVAVGGQCARSSAPACSALRNTYDEPALSGLSNDSGNSLLSTVGQWIEDAFEWFFNHLGHFGSSAVLVVLALLALALIIRALRNSSGSAAARRRVEDLTGLTTDPEGEWRAALAAAERGDFREAIRRGFRSVLLRLAVAGRTRIEATWTTRELLDHVREDSELIDELATAAAAFDRAWYSGREVTAADWESARASFERLRALRSRATRPAA